MFSTKHPVLIVLSAATLLGGCGGGGSDGGGSTEPPAPDVTGGVVGSDLAFASTSDAQDSALRFVAVTSAGAGSSGNTGALDHDGAAISGGLLGGDLNGARTEVDLTNGGVANLTNPDNLDFVRFFTFEGSQFNRFGVVGVQTGAANLPDAGSATYVGTVRMQATNSTNSYDLTGDIDVTANWAGSPGVTTEFSNLVGSGNNNMAVTANETGTITVADAALSGGAFTGGTASGTGPLFDALSGAANTSGTRGEFFGPAAVEVGGVLSLSQGDLEITGVYAGGQP